jgi:hypothetical protein
MRIYLIIIRLIFSSRARLIRLPARTRNFGKDLDQLDARDRNLRGGSTAQITSIMTFIHEAVATGIPVTKRYIFHSISVEATYECFVAVIYTIRM